jgi:predicted N-acyltransferase
MGAKTKQESRIFCLSSGTRDMFVEEMKSVKEWEDFLEVTPKGTFYHSIKWKEVVQRTFNYSSLYLVIKDNTGRIVGICPGFITSSMYSKIYDSIPHSDYGGPIMENHYAEGGSLLLRNFLQEFCPGEGIGYAKFFFLDESGLSRFFKSQSGGTERTVGTMEIDLKTTPSDFLWNKRYSRNLKKRIKRVEQDGFQAQEAKTKSDLLEFYNLYTQNMKHIGASPDPFRFVENMWNALHPDNLRIWLLRKDRAVGAELFLQNKKGSYARYAAVDREQARARLSPINYLRWVEIEKAEQEGRRYVSFGSTPSDPYHPYRLQKERIGCSFHPQEMMWYSFTSTGYALIRTRAKTAPAWKAVRRFLPIGLRGFLERRLLEF